MSSGSVGLSERVRDLVGVGLEPEELAHPPVGSTVWCEASPDATRVTVTYVARDDYPPPVLHDGRGWRGTVVQVRPGPGAESAVADFVEAARREGTRAYAADAHAPMDVRTLREGPVEGDVYLYRGPAPGTARPDGSPEGEEAAALEIRAHAAWRADELHGIVTETFRVQGEGTLVPLDQRAVWPRLALADVEVMLEEGLSAVPEAPAPAP